MMMAMAEEMEPMMQKEPSEKPQSEKQMSEKQMSEKQMSDRQSTQAPEEEPEELRYCGCCCCLCDCSEREYRDLSCCGCFPVKCGIYTIGILAVLLTALIFLETFMMLMADHIAWWFVLVSVLLQIPLIIGLIFFLNFFGEDSDATRGKLRSACILAIVSFSLQITWNIVYFWILYKPPNIVVGNDEAPVNFTVSKKLYLFWTSFFYLWAIFAYGYFICVVGRYAYRLRNKEEEKEEEAMMMMGDEEKNAEMNN